MEKRGQVTAFILLGLVLILVIGGYFAISNYLNKQDFLTQLRGRSQIPIEIQPAVTAVDACTKQVGEEALTQIGLQGGYLQLPADPIPSSSFTPVPAALEILPNSGLKTSLWFREAGNGIRETTIPSKTQVEQNIADYINQNFQRCANIFKENTELTVTQSLTPKTTVDLLDEATNIVVSYPVTIQFKDTTFSINEFGAQIDVKFGKLYTLAKQIFQKENEILFFENKTIDTLIAYNPEIPFSGVESSCTPRTWSKSDSIKKLKDILADNINVMKIKGTNYAPDERGRAMEFQAGVEEKEVTANLHYSPSFPTYIEITPSKGDLLKSDAIPGDQGSLLASLVSPYFCLTEHHFVYTIKYPVIISLTDAKGFTFQYAFEVILEKNQPRRSTLEPIESPVPDARMCEYLQAPLKINTYTIDAKENLKPLENVDLNLKCFPQTCPLKKISEQGEQSAVVAPACGNGIIEGRKEGYTLGKTIVSTNTNDLQEINVVLDPIYTKQIEMYVIEKKTGQIRKPYPSENIMFQFTHKKPVTLSSSIAYQEEGNNCAKEDDCGSGLTCQQNKCVHASCQKQIDCTNDQTCAAGKCKPKNELQLTAGDYQVNYYVLRSSTWPIKTPKQKIENCVTGAKAGLLGFFQTQEQCITTDVESVELNTGITGGATFDYSIAQERLADNVPLKLYALVDDLPADMEGFSNIQIAFAGNKDHPYFKQPE
ncbi:hypothetical protein HZB00_03695 [Candidatus Woesearchaeota archaeon]|nr:hypothetical protein [Candidatus Woesearchaeota archaeon]